jgi:hypothetical protein
MDTFRELSPEELKLTTLQFIGQTISGDLKELDSNIISRNRTLQGKTIDPVGILKTVPAPQGSSMATTVNAGINIAQPGPQLQPIHNIAPQPQIVHTDPNQLEFDFDKKAKYSDIYDSLVDLKNRLIRIENLLDNDKE